MGRRAVFITDLEWTQEGSAAIAARLARRMPGSGSLGCPTRHDVRAVIALRSRVESGRRARAGGCPRPVRTDGRARRRRRLGRRRAQFLFGCEPMIPIVASRATAIEPSKIGGFTNLVSGEREQDG